MRTSIAAIIALAAAASAVSPAVAMQSQPAATAQTPDQAVTAFLEAFDTLDSERFSAFFADDATMFFPNGPFPQARVEGKTAVTAAFGRLFDMARQRGVTRLSLRPLDVQVQDHGAFAVATFHLRGNGNIGRRSIILRRDGSAWRIVHFHASSLEERPASDG